MIDWHSHILPAIDDGCRDTNESLAVLEQLRKQGIDTVVMTPHFYAGKESVDSFLERRSSSYEALKGVLPSNTPKILAGAEVKYYSGISRLSELSRLKIEPSELLLLEMPMSKWSEYTIKELIELSSAHEFQIVLAHVERYARYQKSNIWDMLSSLEIPTQVNADFFINRLTRHRAISLLKNQAIHFIGSDCHNLSSRPPKISDAFDIIRKNLGDEFLNQMYEYGLTMLT